MTVTQRTAPEYDKSVGPHNNMRKVIIFPWRAVHEDTPGCNFRGVFYTEAEAASALATHTCSRQFKGYNGLSIAEQYWLELDRVMDEIKLPSTDDDKLPGLRGRAGGLAYALVIACSPYYNEEKDISREALRRWKMRNGQLDWEPTPGFKYNPPLPGANPGLITASGEATASYTSEHNKGTGPTVVTNPPASGRRRRAATATPVERELTEVELKTIRTALLFPAKDLAGMYGVSVATIERIRAEANE